MYAYMLNPNTNNPAHHAARFQLIIPACNPKNNNAAALPPASASTGKGSLSGPNNKTVFTCCVQTVSFGPVSSHALTYTPAVHATSRPKPTSIKPEYRCLSVLSLAK